ncbi:MAG: ATP-binding cassette domain-containing protein [Acholeplasmataceae bacterium]|nr:ATP-binding cassette domain-containing protein [Acholeplasmataceae bacterium]
MIELKGISRIYKLKRSEPVHALNKIDLVFGKKGMVFVLGKSGSGKSTLLNVIGGLDKYNEGELIVKGKSTKAFRQSDFDSYRNTMIGFIFQDYNVLDEFTVAQNIGLALELQGKKATSENISAILNQVDLAGYGRRKPNELSGGQKQRVAIARALVKNPEVIMADEPTGALDSVTGKQVLETLKKLSETRLVIVVSHDREFAETYGSRIIEFKDGEIISDVTKVDNEASQKQEIEYNDKKIVVKRGYTLTALDVKVINEYLKNQTSDTAIERALSGHTFVDTDHEKISISDEPYHSIKSKLPFKSSLKVGASSLKHKTFRLVIAIILAAVAFALFGITDTMGSFDKHKVTTASISDSNINYVGLSKMAQSSHNALKFNNDDIVIMNHDFPGLKFKPVYLPDDAYLDYSLFLFGRIKTEDQRLDLPTFSGFYELTTQDISAFQMDLMGNSRLPQADNEIVISKYNFDLFQKYNYRDYSDPTVEVNINNVNDILNKTITFNNQNFFTVVGVVDTHFDLGRYSALKQTPDNMIFNYFLSAEYMTVREYSHHNLVFVNDGYIGRNKVDNGINTNELYSQHFILTDDTNDFYFTYFNKVSKYNSSEIVFLKGKNKNNLAKTDIIISRNTMDRVNSYTTDFYDTYGDFVSNHIQTYISTLSVAQLDILIKRYDSSFDTFANVPIAERPTIYQNLYYAYYSYRGQEDNGVGRLPQELYDEAEQAFYNNYNPFEIALKISTYSQIVTEEFVDLNVVGFFNTDPDDYNAPNVVALSDAQFADLVDVVPGDYQSLLSAIDPTQLSIIQKLVNQHYTKGQTVYVYNNEITVTLSNVNGFIESLAQIFLYVGISFAVFASLLLFNFISTSVSYKKKEIGILRAIGARGRDVLGIFTKESTIIALINFTLAIVGLIATAIIINKQIETEYGIAISILQPGVRQVALMLAVTLFVGFVSSALPVSRIARKRPIDAIRQN